MDENILNNADKPDVKASKGVNNHSPLQSPPTIFQNSSSEIICNAAS